MTAEKTNIPTLTERLDAIGYQSAKEAIKTIDAELEKAYEEVRAAMNDIMNQHGIAAEDFYFNPAESYIRLEDHKARRLHKNTWMCIDLVRNGAGMATGLLGIRFEAKQYIQDVEPQDQNLIVCAETLEYFAELMRAFESKELVQDYLKCINQYTDALGAAALKRKQHDATVRKGDKFIEISKNIAPYIECGIDSMEDAVEYFKAFTTWTLGTTLQSIGIETCGLSREELLQEVMDNISSDETI